jgi:transcriptional regulator with XRE-family HTH domain
VSKVSKVSKARKSPPNDLLRNERLRRGWSREYVAAEIGVADPKTIGRWERGDATPSAYFRQKLCSFFGLSAQELGLYQEKPIRPEAECGAAQPATEACCVREQSALLLQIYDPAIPLVTAESLSLVGRTTLLQCLKSQLLERPGGPALGTTVALYGLPGVGKTALALALVHDRELQAHFDGGILWATLGTTPDLAALLRHWAGLLAVPLQEQDRGSRTPSDALEEWGQTLRAAIGKRRMLLVLDDVWSYAAALRLMVGGPECAYLLTTRLPAVAFCFANERALHVPELDEAQSLALLARFAPLAVSSERSAVEALVKASGGLPLALILMARYLQAQAYSEQPRRLRAALERLQCAALRLHLQGTSPLPEPSSYRAPAAPPSVAAALEISYRRLSREARCALQLLATFPPKPQTFSEAAIEGRIPGEVLDELTDAGLLESAGGGRYMLHPLIADYVRLCPEAQKALPMSAQSAFSQTGHAAVADHDSLPQMVYPLREERYLQQSPQYDEEHRARSAEPGALVLSP